LKIFTDLPLDEIALWEALQGAEINDAKKVLATEATALLHGRAEALKAEKAARATFEQGARSDDLPSVSVPKAEFTQGLRVATALAKAGLVGSNGEGKRAIQAKAVSVNDAPVTDEAATLTDADIVNGAVKLSFGRKKHALLKVE
jgi:tyrosyl-tRNA synthetase